MIPEADCTTDPWLYAIAAFATSPSKALDDRGREATLTRVVDTLGCALGARGADATAAATSYAARRAGGGVHAVWGTDVRTDLEGASLANGVAVRYLDYNDAYYGLDPFHPSDVIPTLFAFALEERRNDDDFLDAVAVAYEVAIAAADRVRLGPRGWDHVNVTMLGAVAGAARLLGLTDEQARHAVAIAVASHAAYRQVRTGQLSMWKAFAAADACRHAAYAAVLAASGARGPAAPFTGQNAMFARALGLRPEEFPTLPLTPGAQPRRIEGTQIKRFPCGSVGQSAGQAATDLVQRGIGLADVESIDVRLDPKAAPIMVSPEKFQPKTRETADHSIPYVIVSTLQRGALTVESFSEEVIGSEEIQAFLRHHVAVEADPALEGGHDLGFPVALRLTMKDGRVEHHTVKHPPGSPGNPMDREAVRAKFHRMSGRSSLAGTADELWDLAWSAGGQSRTVPELDSRLSPP